MKKLVLALVLGLGFISFVNAQKIVLKEGSLDFLEGEKFIMIEYDYSDMGVGKYEDEEDYLNKKVEEYNADEPGRGDKWKESWIADRKEHFEPNFEELLNKYLDKEEVYVGEENTDAKYTMIVKTTFTEPGFNAYVVKKYASINVEVLFVETENPDKVMARIISKDNPGRSYGYGDMDTGIRIGEAYAKCGKELGKYLVQKAY